MKSDDIQRICEAGLITAEQRDRILEHFHLKEENSRFLVIISFLGAILVAGGVALLISAHWNDIPGGVKIAAGLGLMLGAHGLGWWLREVDGRYWKTGEALMFLGSCLLLANIALIGQVYNISSRTPNAFLAWMIGIAALPWLLRSRAQFVLLLTAFCIWLGCEINARDSVIRVDSPLQVVVYSLVGLNLGLAGGWLRRTSYAELAGSAEKLGALGMLLFAWPLTWSAFGEGSPDSTPCLWVVPALAGLAAVLAMAGIRHLTGLTRQWQRVWAGTQMVAAGLLCAVFFSPQHEIQFHENMTAVNMGACFVLFVYFLLQIRAGLQLGSPFRVNLGVVMIALDMVSAYFGLFGTMAYTGMMFIVSGLLLLTLGVILERQRRLWLKDIKKSSTPEVV